MITQHENVRLSFENMKVGKLNYYLHTSVYNNVFNKIQS